MAITAELMKKLDSSYGDVKVFAAGSTTATIKSSDLPKDKIINKETIIVKSRGYIGFEYYNGLFTHKSEMWSYSDFDDCLDLKFTYYYLLIHAEEFQRKARANSVKLPQLCVADTDDFLVPLPPLPVQKEIVRVLDSFVCLQENLQKELEAREKQYEVYREKLLNTNEMAGEDIEWVTLDSICEIRGRIGFRGYTRADQVSKGCGPISLSPSNIVDSHMDYKSCTYISRAKYEESPEIITNNGDIIFCKTASVGKVALVDNLPCEATINPQLVVLKNIKTDTKYLFYVLDSHRFQTEVKTLAGVGSVPNIGQAKMGAIRIPVPSRAVQEKVVDYLNAFEGTILNIKSEILTRQKQYEHYRESVLSF